MVGLPRKTALIGACGVVYDIIIQFPRAQIENRSGSLTTKNVVKLLAEKLTVAKS